MNALWLFTNIMQMTDLSWQLLRQMLRVEPYHLVGVISFFLGYSDRKKYARIRREIYIKLILFDKFDEATAEIQEKARKEWGNSPHK